MYIYIYVYVCIYIYIYTCLFTFMYTHIYGGFLKQWYPQMDALYILLLENSKVSLIRKRAAPILTNFHT